jgi:hypothetical protein
MAPNTKPENDPSGGHDPDALEDAAEKMGVDRDEDTEDEHTRDPQGGHDRDALDDAAKKMGVER